MASHRVPLMLICCLASAFAERTLFVKITPNASPETTPFDSRLAIKSPDIAPNDPRVAKPEGCSPQQLHLTWWGPTSVLVSWASCDGTVGYNATKPKSTEGVQATVMYGTKSGQYDNKAMGTTTSYAYDYSATNNASYSSPFLHHVLLQGLAPGNTCYYKVMTSFSSKQAYNGSSGQPVPSRELNFTVPAGTFPFRLGVMADPGQTYNSTEVLGRMIGAKPQALVIVGDFCYADTWFDFNSTLDAKGVEGGYAYQPKWDTWGRLFEPLLSQVPVMHTNGNHEIEQLPNGERDTSYNHRYPVPMDKSKGPTSFTPVSRSDPFINLFYSVELPGVFKYIFITSYSPNQTFSHDEAQYKWLENELKQTDRSKTPWLLVSTHAPWYNTYAGHYKENECMRQSYEPLLLQYKVDLMFFGHVHAYERTKPVADWQVDECGPVHFTVGDGGNIEGMYKDFIDTKTPKPEYCANPKLGTQFPKSYQPQACYSYQNGEYCFSSQPDWSAYREPSFGFGTLDFINATHAVWQWTKNQWPAYTVADQVTIIRGENEACRSSSNSTSSSSGSKQSSVGRKLGSVDMGR